MDLKLAAWLLPVAFTNGVEYARQWLRQHLSINGRKWDKVSILLSISIHHYHRRCFWVIGSNRSIHIVSEHVRSSLFAATDQEAMREFLLSLRSTKETSKRGKNFKIESNFFGQGIRAKAYSVLASLLLEVLELGKLNRSNERKKKTPNIFPLINGSTFGAGGLSVRWLRGLSGNV